MEVTTAQSFSPAGPFRAAPGGASPGPGLHRRRGAPGARGPLPRFRRAQRGTVAIEAALSLSVLVAALAGLMGIVQTTYKSDTLERAARAAARAVALEAEAPASASALDAVVCGAIKSELNLSSDFDCGAKWTITVDAYETPAALLAGTARSGDDATIGGENGDMVLVRIRPLADEEDADTEDTDGEESAQGEEATAEDVAEGGDGEEEAGGSEPEPAQVLAAGVARNERAG